MYYYYDNTELITVKVCRPVITTNVVTEYVLKALSSLSTTEEKLAALCKKYTDLLDENRQNASSLKTTSKKLSQVSRERDSLQTENSKLILAKSKLETLCRELQRHNKTVKVSRMQFLYYNNAFIQ